MRYGHYLTSHLFYVPLHARKTRARQVTGLAGVAALLAAGILGIVSTLSGAAPASAAAPGGNFTQAVHQRAHAQTRYVVRDGDTLTSIARHVYGHASRWPALWYLNRDRVPNPNALRAGQQLRLSGWHPAKPWIAAAALSAIPKPPPPPVVSSGSYSAPAVAQVPASYQAQAQASYGGHLSYAQLEQLWLNAGGPSWAASHAASIAQCESGGNASAYNPSGATGVWQILGQVSGGDLTNPAVNAANAVSKFNASGQTFAAWVCQ